jgi:hypothetical protein
MSECRLWKHVICQAISDAYLGSNKEKLAVAEWIMSSDFDNVCDLATLESDRLRKMIHEILTSKSVVARFLGERLKKVIQNRALVL